MPISRIETNSIAPSQTLTTPIIATTMGVGGATPAGSGSGITFPAAQSASTDANTLDDYEEGTWTPTFAMGGGNGSLTYQWQVGRYTKVGDIVNVTCYVQFASKTGASGQVRIVLPFTVGGSPLQSYQTGAMRNNGISGISGGFQCYTAPGDNKLYVEYSGTGTTNALDVSSCASSADFMVNITYKVA